MTTAKSIWKKVEELRLSGPELLELNTLLCDESIRRQKKQKPFSVPVKALGRVKRVWDSVISGKLNIQEIGSLASACRGEEWCSRHYSPYQWPQFPDPKPSGPSIRRTMLKEIRRV